MSFLLLLPGLLLGLHGTEDLRELSGMTQEDVAAVEDGGEFYPLEPTFKKLLYRTGTVEPVILSQWTDRTSGVSLQQIADDAASYRFAPFSFDASVESIQRFDYAPYEAKNFLSGFYVANCKTNDGIPFTLISRSSVASWPDDRPLNEPQTIRFDGFFLGNLSIELERTSIEARPVFVTRRFAWHPDRVNESLDVDAAKVFLAQSGVDLSLLDIVKSRKGKSIGTREAIGFWQMLAACRNKPTESLGEKVGFADMLGDPLGSVGRACSVKGRVRQCVPVKVTDDKAIELLGTNTWFQLSVFPNLDGRPVEVATRSGQPEVYQNSFPVTVCVVDLPQGFDTESIVGKVFRYDGFFYRIWSYPSERTENSELDGQPSPLMMASSLVKIKSTSGQLQTMLGSMLLAMAVAVGFVSWFVFRSKPGTSRTELPEKIESW